MGDNSLDNKRIAKNTLMLYVRMFLMMGVTLYTSRVILQALGVDDFGIYDIVGGIVVLFSFINNAMVISTQRFLNFELGRNNPVEARKMFSASLSIHIAVAILFLLLAETAGLWFLRSYIQIPEGRETAAFWVYQFSIAATIVNIIRAPYNAAIIAHEKMSFYAYISVIEALLKLAVAFLVCSFADRLIAYAALIATVAIVVLAAYYAYCRRNFKICRYRYEFDKARYKSLAGFSGWSLFGSVANLGAQQGTNIILNMFFGVAINAAMGIANQVNTAIYLFVSNFQTAFNPQIIKSYAAGAKEYFTNLILNTSRYSFVLLFVLALPVYICCPGILRIWLGAVPDYAVEFCQLMILFSLVDAIQGPLWVSVQATGKIRNYQILMSCLILLNLPISYTLFLFFKNPEIALMVRVGVNIVTSTARVAYLHRLYRFPVRKYAKDVVARGIAIMLVAYPVPYIVYLHTGNTVGSVATAFACAVIACLLVGIKASERKMIAGKARAMLHRHNRQTPLQ